ncbi:MAG TPA: hypothetical protein VGK01_20280 [Candidatus Angelobacter sp.]
MNPCNFFSELKQRNVYRVAIAYAVVAWLLMQVASQIFPFFEIPNWTVRLVVLLLIIGFPVALTVREQVLVRPPDEYRSAGNLRFFDQIKKLLMDEPGRPSQAQVASEFGMTEKAVKQAFHRFRQRYQTLLREEVSHAVAMPSDIEDELRHLIAVVRAYPVLEYAAREEST